MARKMKRAGFSCLLVLLGWHLVRRYPTAHCATACGIFRCTVYAGSGVRVILVGPPYQKEVLMTELQFRGYMMTHAMSFLRERIGPEWPRVQAQFSPEMQALLTSDIKHAGWYRMSLFNEITRQIIANVGSNEPDASREALFQCGKYMAREATNTFLKILLKLLTPGLLAKKLPELLKRDFTSGRLVAEMNGRTLSCEYIDMGEFEHCIAMAPGFVATAFEAMGKKIEKVEIPGWSLDKPSMDRARYELTWRE
jgi:hypothetical protein